MPTEYETTENQMDTEMLEIEKRKSDNDKKVMDTLKSIFRKSKLQLTDYDKSFLRARASYLTDGQRREYADVLNQEKELTADNYSKNQLIDIAIEKGIDPEVANKFKNKQEAIDAIKALPEEE